jgi:hypothetical protein
VAESKDLHFVFALALALDLDLALDLALALAVASRYPKAGSPMLQLWVSLGLIRRKERSGL